ncbi:transaldolase [Streptomyces sporangiiformans]|uniref:Transaldolase n=1 Tax=Streptomyces sporangiiformans TaxID=2315329 RepID=A0A505DPS5_9ACTN|nr:transaldolase [Streptomyces sporangiiformans]TPQ23225.1 transaldolase [Streptomyces sporangiiformans]
MITVTDISAPVEPLKSLSDEGVSIWLDDLSRTRITSGNLAELIEKRNVVGVTTNPSIFQSAIGSGEGYEEQLAELAVRGVTVDEAVRMMTTADVRAAADILRPVYDATGGRDGRVSIEVDPRLAHRTAATVAEAKQLAWLVDRPNVMIKIPATEAGLPAITEVIGLGISVNVTLIFSLERYREVMDAYLAGLEKARAAGLDLSAIHSVASFFVSRVDSEVDKRLAKLGSDEALALRGRAALANARLAYEAYEDVFGSAGNSTQSSDRWTTLAPSGAHRQRPLWASTGVKDPAYKDTLYVDELVAPGTVNTMPEATLTATADHGDIRGDTVSGGYAQAHADLDAIERLGIAYDEVVRQLEDEGVAKFEAAWGDLLDAVAASLSGKGVVAE